MDAEFTAEQRQIRQALADLLARHCAPGQVRAAVRTEAGYDAALWRRLAGELGLVGLALPQEYGGAGFGPTELVLACEEAGRVLLPSPLLATGVMVAPLVAEVAGDGLRRALLPRLASGEAVAALVLPGTPRDPYWSGGGRAGGVQAHAGEGGRWTLYGQAAPVPGAHRADLLVVAAHTGGYARGRTALFLVEGDAPGLTRTRLAALDETRPLARVELRRTPAVPLADPPGADAGPALERAGDLAAAALAAEAVGAADRVLAGTVEYVKAREQFGRPVGSFQAVQHRLADGWVRVQSARSAAYYAAWAAGEDPDALRTAAPLALAAGLEALRAVAGEAVQLHGGIGFTWEHHAHLYLKRAAADAALFGPPHVLRARAAQRAGLFAGPPGRGEGSRTGPSGADEPADAPADAPAAVARAAAR